MIIFPAIDLRDGKCVRLLRGDFAKETIYSSAPEEVALRWEREGAEYLHVVDLDGALAGKPKNTEVIKKILSNVQIPIELGGGIRTLETIENTLALGVTRVILGSAAVQNRDLVKEACRLYGDRIAVGIDAKDGIAAVDGWGISGGISAVDLAKELASYGLKTIIYTDIARDGTLSGVNIEATAKLAAASGIDIIASGGVKSLEDIHALKVREEDGIIGVIAGKSIYEGTLSLPEAIAAAH